MMPSHPHPPTAFEAALERIYGEPITVPETTIPVEFGIKLPARFPLAIWFRERLADAITGRHDRIDKACNSAIALPKGQRPILILTAEQPPKHQQILVSIAPEILTIMTRRVTPIECPFCGKVYKLQGPGQYHTSECARTRLRAEVLRWPERITAGSVVL